MQSPSLSGQEALEAQWLLLKLDNWGHRLQEREDLSLHSNISARAERKDQEER